MSIQVTCPTCRATVTVPGAGRFQCAYCGGTVEVSAQMAAAATSPQTTPEVTEPPQAPEFAEAPPAPEFTPPAGFAEPSPKSPPPVEVEAPPYASAGPEPIPNTPCANHPLNPAVTVCERCGDFICRLCFTAVEGRAYCPKCFDLLYQRGAFRMGGNQNTQPAITLGLGIAAILSVCLCLPLAPILGGVGIFFGLRAVKQHREQPDLPGWGMTTTGLTLSGVTVGLFVLILLGIAAFFALSA